MENVSTVRVNSVSILSTSGFVLSFAGSLSYSAACEISCPDANPNVV